MTFGHTALAPAQSAPRLDPPMKANTRIQRRALAAAIGASWLAVVVASLAGLAAYDNRPGVPARAPAAWPAESRVPREPGHPTLVMLVHPRCTCSRASLAELAELLARAPHPPTATVVLVVPTGSEGDWQATDLARRAARIPSVTVVRDPGGREALRFGSHTSGQTLLYDGGGRLLFSGGITGSRGHEGDNLGRATVLALLERQQPDRDGSAVFGCPLISPNDEPQPGASAAAGSHAS
jgi:hypothetical protein